MRCNARYAAAAVALGKYRELLQLLAQEVGLPFEKASYEMILPPLAFVRASTSSSERPSRTRPEWLQSSQYNFVSSRKSNVKMGVFWADLKGRERAIFKAQNGFCFVFKNRILAALHPFHSPSGVVCWMHCWMLMDGCDDPLDYGEIDPGPDVAWLFDIVCF